MTIDWSQYSVDLKESEPSTPTDIWTQYQVNPKGEKEEEEEIIFSPGGAALKGIVRGATQLAKTRDPVRQLIEPFQKKDVSRELQEKAFQSIFPSGETPIESGAEKIGELLPLAAGGGPQGYIRAIAGGISSEALKQAGAPKWTQDLAELVAFMSPKLGKKLAPVPSQKEAVQFLKKKNLTDKEIIPLLKSEKQIRRYGKFAHKGKNVIDRLTQIHRKLGSGYTELKKHGEQLPLPIKEVTKFEDSILNKFKELTPNQQNLIEKEVRTLLGKPITARSMIDFAQDVFEKGSVARRAGAKTAKQAVSIMKDPIRKFMPLIDKEVAKEYKLLDEFWAKKNQVIRNLKPSEFDKAIELAEAAGVVGGLVTGNFSLLKKTLGILGARTLYTQMLMSPRLQNLGNQMLKAASQNKPAVIKKLYDTFIIDLEEHDKELAKKLRKKSSGNSKTTSQ